MKNLKAAQRQQQFGASADIAPQDVLPVRFFARFTFDMVGDVGARGFYFAHCRRQAASDVFGCLFQRIIVEMCIALRRGALRVT